MAYPFDEIIMYGRFVRDLRRFLREPITLERAQQTVKQRLLDREKHLLAIVKKAVYENERSPYFQLLRLIGCEYGDFEHMVKSDGIENSLGKLCEKGVYVTIDEFKGRKEAVRGSKAFKFEERDFENPFLAHHFEARSGASRSTGTRTIYDYEFVAANRAVCLIILLDAYDALNIPHAICFQTLPGCGPIRLLEHAKVSKIPVKWFAPLDRRSFATSLRSRLGNDYIVYMGRLMGAKFPKPEWVSLHDLRQVAQWVSDTVNHCGGCYLATFTSIAVKICQTARESGLDITGAKFSVTGEPLTDVKRREIESAGASVCPNYIFVEAGYVGIGCFSLLGADDVHFLKDSFALIQYQREVPHASVSVNAFLFTSLLPSAPKVLLNAESGDYGLVETRRCGCKFGELGLTEHIRHIRGFDKLTSAGMTFIGSDLLKVMEEILPARFGGYSTDYQMVEEEDEKGHSRISIVVSPDIGTIDEAEVISTVLAEISKGKDTQRMMAEMWSQADTLRVKRIKPLATARGKLLPLHIQR